MSGWDDSGRDPKYDWGGDYHTSEPDREPSASDLLFGRCILALICPWLPILWLLVGMGRELATGDTRKRGGAYAKKRAGQK